MKRISIGLFLTFLGLIIFSACQENIYIDWKLANDQWYAKHKSDSGFVVTSSGLCYKFIHEGSKYARQPKPSSDVLVKYKGTLVDGTVFDKAASPARVTLSSAIAGWKEIMPKMHSGDSVVLYIPSSLAYDTISTNTVIPPHSVLIFGVNLVDSQY